jgi:hypothetical protein
VRYYELIVTTPEGAYIESFFFNTKEEAEVKYKEIFNSFQRLKISALFRLETRISIGFQAA